MADEEPVDQKKYLEESCKPKCVKPLLEYQLHDLPRKDVQLHVESCWQCSICSLNCKCKGLAKRSSACVKRIQGDETGHKHCTGQYFDYWSCIDKCVATKLFSKLK